MRPARSCYLLSLLAFAGCATIGIGSAEEEVGAAPTRSARVPVFDAAPDVPCSYAELGGVNGAIIIDEPSEFRVDMKRELGLLGARRGADAVIMAADIELPLTAGSGQDPVAALVGKRVEVQGMAIEYTEPCGTLTR